MMERVAHNRRRLLLLAAGWVAIVVPTAFGQGAESPATASGSAQPVKRDYRFEVASIRPADPPTGHKGPPEPAYSPGRYRENNVSFAVLAWKGFSVKHAYEIEYPRWMGSTYFTLNATLPEGATKADLPIMIQHLLEDRFGLVFHHEMRRMGGYELVVAKSGLRLAASAGPVSDGSTIKGPSIEVKNGVPQFTKDAGSGQLLTLTMATWRGRNKTMNSLAADLAGELGAPVMDATGLEGEYDYTLTFSPEVTSSQANVVSPLPLGGAPGPAVGEGAPPVHLLLRDALQEQLGLKLQPVRNVPVDVVVLDSAKKEPSEN